MSEGKKFNFGGDNEEPKKKRSQLKPALLACAAIIGATGYTYYLQMNAGDGKSLETSTSQEFQQDQTGLGRIQLRDPNPIAPQTPIFDLSGFDAQQANQRAENKRLQTELERLRAAQEGGSATNAEIQKQVRELTALISDQQQQSAQAQKTLATEIQKALKSEREIWSQEMQGVLLTVDNLQTDNEKLRLAMIEKENTDQLAAMQAQIAAQEQQRQKAELEAARAKANELRDAQIRSKSVVYDNGQRQNSGQSSGGSATPPALGPDGQPLPPTVDAQGRAFVEDRSRPVETIQSEVIANPSITVPQGSAIIASLETAIDSQLPGQIIAVVNHPVESMDAKNVLIPEGSKIFGEYQTAQNIGERRIQVAWTRLVTPDGRSIRMQSYGADQLGRSGVTGKVNSRWGQKFAAAALVSIFAAAPQIAAQDINDEDVRDTVSEIGANLADTLADSLKPYIELKPIIKVKQGTLITVIVNQDIEIHQ